MAQVDQRPKVDRIPIRIGDWLATITAPSRLSDELRSTFVDSLRHGDGPPGADIEIRARGREDRIFVDGRLWDPGPDQTTTNALIYALLRATLDAESDRLHVHAAGLDWRGRGVWLAGGAGAGKSTLAAVMVEAGFGYVTDERLGVEPDGRISAFTAPISVTATSFDVLERFDPRRTGVGAASARLWHLPASAIRPASASEPTAPALLVFLDRSGDQPDEIVEVHRAAAVRMLLADSPDARRFGPRGVALLGRVVSAMRTVSLSVDGPAAAATSIVGLVDGGASGNGRCAPIFGSDPAGSSVALDDVDMTAVPLVAPDLAGALIDGRAVLQSARDGRVVELDEVASSWVGLIDGRSTLASIIGEVAAANEMSVALATSTADAVMAELMQMGVVVLVRPR